MKSPLLFILLVCTVPLWAQMTPICSTPQVIYYQDSLTPGYADAVSEAFLAAKQYGQNHQEKSTGSHTIPVVFHIVYHTPEENIPDSVIHNQIQILNEDFNRLNADTANMRPEFEIVKGNPNINFELAQLDPNGNPTSGITRTYTDSLFGSVLLFFGYYDETEKVKSTASGGKDPWDQSKYLNIWVCSLYGEDANGPILVVSGYASPPLNLPNWPQGMPVIGDGIVMHHEAVGSNNPNPLDTIDGPIESYGRICTHEVGHYLGLRHISGDGDCTAEDGIDDTPNTTIAINVSCYPFNNCIDNIQGIDLPDMFENYMGNAPLACKNSFTQGQADLMNAVLENQRYDLVHSNASIQSLNKPLTCYIHPNPAQDQINISSSELLLSAEIISLSGRVVKNVSLQNEAIVDITELESGVYLLKIYGDDDRYVTERIVVN